MLFTTVSKNPPEFPGSSPNAKLLDLPVYDKDKMRLVMDKREVKFLRSQSLFSILKAFIYNDVNVF